VYPQEVKLVDMKGSLASKLRDFMSVDYLERRVAADVKRLKEM
jgi:hypothetical protein